MSFRYLNAHLRKLWPTNSVTSGSEGDYYPFVIHPEDVQSLMSAIIDSRERMAIFAWRGRVELPGGDIRWLQARSFPKSRRGGVVWTGIFLDATEEGRLEAELKSMRTLNAERARLASIGEIAAMIGHEMNTPLGSILLLADQILTQVNKPEIDRDAIRARTEQMRHVIGKLTEIIRTMRKSSVIESKPDHVRLNDVIANALLLCSDRISARGIELVRAYETRGELSLEVAEAALLQILLNLIKNAKDAVMSNDKKRIRIDWERIDGAVLIHVIDNGCGMSPEQMGKLFEPFYSTKMGKGGTGLGLSISKGVADRNGWKIEVSTNSGGSHFTIVIPLSAASSASAA